MGHTIRSRRLLRFASPRGAALAYLARASIVPFEWSLPKTRLPLANSSAIMRVPMPCLVMLSCQVCTSYYIAGHVTPSTVLVVLLPCTSCLSMPETHCPVHSRRCAEIQ
eukprot:scaffold229321_cov27-Tisochrysis_lutea.AAC.1